MHDPDEPIERKPAIALAKELERVLPREPAREAVDAIRGYEWQRWLTALEWLRLTSVGALWIEWAEDLTVVDTGGVRTIQAKDVAANLSLGTAAIQSAASKALERGEVRTVYWTTAKPGIERNNPFGEAGIVHWKKVAEGAAEPTALRAFLLAARAISDPVKATIVGAPDAEFRSLLSRMEWITGEGDLSSLRQSVEQQVSARIVAITGLPALAVRRASLADLIVGEVTRVGLIPEAPQRCLTAERLDRLLQADNLDIHLAAAPTFQAAAQSAREAEALGQRVEQLRRAAGFYRLQDDPMAGWRLLAQDILSGRYDAASPNERQYAIARTAWALSDPEVGGDVAGQLLSLLDGQPEGDTLRLARIAVLSQADPEAALRRLRDIPSPEARGQQIIVLTRIRGAAAAVDWALDHSARDLSSIGAYHVLMQLMVLGRWDEAATFADSLTADQRRERPFLHALRGFALVGDVMKPHERDDFLAYPLPMRPRDITDRLIADHELLSKRLPAAAAEFVEAARAAEQLGSPFHVTLFNELRTWVELEEPSLLASSRAALKRRLATGEQFSSTVVFASLYGLDFDRDIARREFESRLALGGFEPADFRAVFVLYEDAEARLSWLEGHGDKVTSFLGEPAATAFRIEQLLETDRLDEADAYLRSARDLAGAADSNLDRLAAAIRTRRGENTSDELRELWTRTEDVIDLHNLCVALMQEKRWSDAGDCALALARKTRQQHYINWALEAQQRARTPAMMLATLDEFPSEVSQSEELRTARATLLIGAGRYREAREAMQELLALPNRDEPEDDYRLLEACIDSGDWDGIANVIEQVWKRRDSRSARRLTEVSVLALERGLEDRARELAQAAAAKPDANANVFMTIWLVAHAFGRELDWPDVGQWLDRAVTLSGPSGPIRPATMEQAVELIPQQQKAKSELSEKLNRAEAPMVFAAEALHVTLTDLILGSAIRNRTQVDPRKRWLIPTIRGGRPAVNLNEAKRLGVDLSTLLVLQALNLLPKALERFELVIPTGTLHTLFAEVQELKLHVQSRAKASMEVLRLAGEGGLTAVVLAPCRDTALLAEVGEDLADLLHHARTARARVCRPAPVHRPGSLLMEPADMSAHASLLCSTRQLMDVVVQAGRLSQPQSERAAAYLEKADEGWSEAPNLSRDDQVFLDELALRYLQSTQLLEPAVSVFGGFAISHSVIDEARSDVALGRMVASLFKEVDHLRTALRDGIEGGRVRLVAPPDDHSPEHRQLILRLLRIDSVDALVVDDRYVNGSGFADTSDGRKPIAASLDLIEALGVANIISIDDLRRTATEVLRCGFFLTPITPRRLMGDMSAAVGAAGFFETAELRAVREYVERIQMVDGSVLADERAYFDTLGQTTIECLKSWWIEAPTIDAARAGADWLWALLPDPRSLDHIWIEKPPPEATVNIRVAHLAGVLFPRLMEADRLKAFRDWAEERIAQPLSQFEPELLHQVANELAGMLGKFDSRMRELDA